MSAILTVYLALCCNAAGQSSELLSSFSTDGHTMYHLRPATLPGGERGIIAGALVLAALSPADFSAAPGDGPEYVLENASIRLGLKDNRLVSVLDKVRSIEHVSPQATSAKGMFRIQWVKGIQPAGELDARDMTSQVTRRDANQIDLAFTHPQALVRVRFVLAKTPGEIECSLSVTPTSGLVSVAHADFPVLVTPSSDSGGVKRCLLPYREGRLTPVNLPLSDEPKLSYFTYPKHLFAQMLACLGTQGGFLLWTDDQKGHSKEFGRDNDHDDSTFAIKHFFPYEPGRPRDISYRSRITLTGPEWQDAADVYRDWASTQPWSAVKLRDRQDIPELLKAPPVCVSGQIDQEDLEALPGKLKAWRDQYQAPVIYRPLGWEKHGNWMGIDYFPTSIGDERFVKTAQRLRADGIVIAGFVSGFAWKTSLGKGEGGDANRVETARLLEQHFQDNHGSRLCEQDRDGNVRKPARVCRGTDFGRVFLQNTAKRLFDLGVSVIHDDVDYGTFQFLSEGCFNVAHGHPVPCGTWEIDITRKAFQEISQEARRRGIEDYFLTKEYYTELLNQDIHASQARFFKAASEPHYAPLAQYLYHEYVFSIFGWGCDNRPLSEQTAMLLVYGQIPCFPSWGKPVERPLKNRLVSDYYDALRAHAKDFLLFGRMRRPLAVTNPNGLPVIQSAWDDERGRVGVFAANTQRNDVVLAVPTPGAGKWKGAFYIGDSPQQVQTVPADRTLEWRLPTGRLASIVFTPDN